MTKNKQKKIDSTYNLFNIFNHLGKTITVLLAAQVSLFGSSKTSVLNAYNRIPFYSIIPKETTTIPAKCGDYFNMWSPLFPPACNTGPGFNLSSAGAGFYYQLTNSSGIVYSDDPCHHGPFPNRKAAQIHADLRKKRDFLDSGEESKKQTVIRRFSKNPNVPGNKLTREFLKNFNYFNVSTQFCFPAEPFVEALTDFLYPHPRSDNQEFVEAANERLSKSKLKSKG